MRGKNITLIIVLILISTSISSVIRVSSREDTCQIGKPDLVFDKFELVKDEDTVYLDWSIKNVGDASTGNDSIRVNFSFCYFGVDYLFNNGIIEYFNLDKYPNLDILLIITYYLHLFILPGSHHGRFIDPLEPGENGTCWMSVIWPMSEFEDDGWFINDNICLIFRGIIDEYNIIAESDETNNQEVIRIWFPYRNEFAELS